MILPLISKAFSTREIYSVWRFINLMNSTAIAIMLWKYIVFRALLSQWYYTCLQEENKWSNSRYESVRLKSWLLYWECMQKSIIMTRMMNAIIMTIVIIKYQEILLIKHGFMPTIISIKSNCCDLYQRATCLQNLILLILCGFYILFLLSVSEASTKQAGNFNPTLALFLIEELCLLNPNKTC